MPYIEREDDRVLAATEWVDRELIRMVPGVLFDPDRKIWRAPLSWATCLAMRGVFQDRLVIGPELTAWANEEYASRIQPSLALRPLTEGIEHDVESLTGKRLFPFQGPGVSWLMWAVDCLLGDDMGAGKTIQMVVALKLLKDFGFDPFPACVIVPNSTKREPWAATFADWDPDVEVVVIGGSPAAKRKQFAAIAESTAQGVPAAAIINWEAVRLHSRLAPYGNQRFIKCIEHGGEDPNIKVSRCESHPKELNAIPWRTVVADEAHKMKDPTSKQTRAVWAVQHSPTVTRRWAATGTPIADTPADLWPIMHGLAKHEYPRRPDFIDRYTLAGFDVFGMLNIVGLNPVTKNEFFGFLDPRFRRMPKWLVLKHLPPKLRQRRYAEMSAKQMKAYTELSDGMVTRLEDGSIVVTTNNLTLNTRLIQFSSAYATVDEEGKVKLTDPSSKIDVLMEILEEAGDRSVVVCAESRQLIELACARLEAHRPKPYSMSKIVGGMSDAERGQSLSDFQSRKTQVMLFTIKAGSVGLTMTAADTIVFLQRSWSMLENKQSEDRVHRIGSEQHESIQIVDIVAPGTVEESQIERLYVKMARLEEITRDSERMHELAAQGDANAAYQLRLLEQEAYDILSSTLDQ
jgi:SNF2 family DNA or RNA helicase